MSWRSKVGGELIGRCCAQSGREDNLQWSPESISSFFRRHLSRHFYRIIFSTLFCPDYPAKHFEYTFEVTHDRVVRTSLS